VQAQPVPAVEDGNAESLDYQNELLSIIQERTKKDVNISEMLEAPPVQVRLQKL
jgi:hypothetical protein